MSKKTPDLSDKMLEGFSIKNIIETSTPMDADKIVVQTKNAEEGLRCLKKLLHDVKSTEDKQERVNIIMSAEANIEMLAWAWYIDKLKVQPIIFDLRPIYGLSKFVDKLLSQIVSKAKKLEKVFSNHNPPLLKKNHFRLSTCRCMVIYNPQPPDI